MIINFDQNMCCTAVCISSLGSCASRMTFTRQGLPFPTPDDFNDLGGWWMISLAALCLDFYDYCEEHAKNGYKNPWGSWRIEQLSTVFCMTSTGESSDRQDKIEELLEEYGFTSNEGYHSKKYRGESLVKLWTMDAEKFAKKSQQIVEEWKNARGVKPTAEVEALPA